MSHQSYDSQDAYYGDGLPDDEEGNIAAYEGALFNIHHDYEGACSRDLRQGSHSVPTDSFITMDSYIHPGSYQQGRVHQYGSAYYDQNPELVAVELQDSSSGHSLLDPVQTYSAWSGPGVDLGDPPSQTFGDFVGHFAAAPEPLMQTYERAEHSREMAYQASVSAPQPTLGFPAPSESYPVEVLNKSSCVQCHILGGHPHLCDRDVLKQKGTNTLEHIREVHVPHRALQWTTHNEILCPWDDENGHCTKELKNEKQLGKHVATVHFRLYEAQCENCKCWFLRPDSLKRHLNEGRCPSQL